MDIQAWLNTGLLSIVAFFMVMTYYRVDAIQKATYKHDKDIAIIKQHCKDVHGIELPA